LLHFGRTYQQCNWKYSKLKNQQDSLEDSEIKVTRPRDWARFIKSCKNSLTAVYYGAFTTNSASENGLQRVNYKIQLYRAINKPTYDSTIVCSISRLVISFDNSQSSIHIKKEELKMISLVKCKDRYGFEENVLVLKQEEKYKSPILHLLANYSDNMVEELKHFFPNSFKTELSEEQSDNWNFIETEIVSIEKTSKVLIESQRINVEKIDDYFHQIRRLINYFATMKAIEKWRD
jgi:hypothetical protein